MNTSSERLEELINNKFLTNRIFKRISENMHYEIFKYIDSETLLKTRELNLGGYQLISNPILRPRIKNLMNLKWVQRSVEEEKSDINLRVLKLMLCQTGNRFSIENINLGMLGYSSL